jgi:hypothetical protein
MVGRWSQCLRCARREMGESAAAELTEQDGDRELAALFQRMREHSRRGAEECKQLMGKRLAEGM